jgi:hypothetical protein
MVGTGGLQIALTNTYGDEHRDHFIGGISQSIDNAIIWRKRPSQAVLLHT